MGNKNVLSNPYDDVKKGYFKVKKIVKKNKPIINKTIESSKVVGKQLSTRFGNIATNYSKSPVLEQDTPIWARKKK